MSHADAMGNSLGNFARYWQAFCEYPRLQGGFIWDCADRGDRKTFADGSAAGRMAATLAISLTIASSG